MTALVLLAGCSSSGGEAGSGPGGSSSRPVSPSPVSFPPSAGLVSSPAASGRAVSPPSAGAALSPPTSVPATGGAASEDVPGTVACGALASAINDGTLMSPGVIDAVVAASATADTPLADAAKRLAQAYETATAAVGTEDEPDAVADVSAVAADMSDVCGESGLDTVG